ncbi:MAG: hypothetical protein CMG21_01565 [Candidatus Marinimicrobia bacterium]|nr:hypothetical protein [Candidatus Neomarinimicrobiota bacterium]
MDTIQIIKINEKQLLLTLNSKEAIKLDLKFNDLKSIIRKIKHNALDDYVISGPTKNKLDELKKVSYELFNILNFFNFKNLFIQFKKQKFNHIQLIVDEYTNEIPFELLHDGKDFLSDFIIFSRLFISTINQSNNNYSIESNEPFSVVCNPSESDDIMIETNDECNYIADLINPLFDLKGPYRKRYVNKIELINLLGTSSLLHFSGHYENNTKKSGWKLFNDLFSCSDIQKISKSPVFIFSNTCGGSSDFFIHSFLNKGSQSIIASLGNLPSKKASEFSQIFYKYFINQNLNLGESFFLSKRDMINKYGKEDLFWCFYQIYGSSFLKINKKNNIKINRKSKSLYFISFLLLSLSSLFIFNFFKNKNYKKVESQFILQKLVIMKNNRTLDNHSNIDSSKNTIIINGKDSIYFKLINKKPIFSLSQDFDRLDLFMKENNNIETLFDYKKDTLNLFFENKDIYNNNEYYHIHFQLLQSKDIKVYIVKKDDHISDYELYLFDKNNDRRYKILISQLIKESKVDKPKVKDHKVITRDDLEKIANPTKHYIYPIGRRDLIKGNIEFNEELFLHIKKVLIK